MGERGVEAEQGGEGVPPTVVPRSPVSAACFHLRRRGLQLPIERASASPFGVELGGVEPVEQLAEEIGVVLTHLTHT